MPPAHDHNERPSDDERTLEALVGPDALHLLNNAELEVLQGITLSQLRDAAGSTAMLLFGRIWYRLEQERRRRKLEVLELERLYFSR